MFRTAYLGSRLIRLNPNKSIGKGGEADVYDIGGLALKIYKGPDHPDYLGEPINQKAAELRLLEQQTKLPAFPPGLPGRVIVPEELAFEDQRQRRIIGYAMRLLSGAEVLMRLSEPDFHHKGMSNATVTQIFRDLYGTVAGLHRAQVVIGDFNDLNVFFIGGEAYIIDADSFQFGRFLTRAYTERFVDLTLIRETTDRERRENANLGRLMLARPHNQESDWYAYAVMLMRSLLCAGPYDGAYIPKNPQNRVPHPARPLHRLTVFRPDVRYPKPAIPFAVLPDELLDHFVRVFEKDERGVFPAKLLEMRWTRCDNCQAEHARGICPFCATRAPGAPKEVTRVEGKVVATEIFRTKSGVVLFATVQNGRLRFLYHENGRYLREGERVVASGHLDPSIRFRIQGETTILGQNGQILVFSPGQNPERLGVDSFGQLPMFDANETGWYWLEEGRLLRNGDIAPFYIGDVLRDQTLFWVGPTFGFGFYRAGGLSVCFVFDANRRAINDNVALGPIRGQLVDSTCVFTHERCWFFVTTQRGGKRINQCWVVRRDGMVEATAEAEENDGSWLGKIRGKCAIGSLLLTATDEGIVRVDIDNRQIVLTREFPDTEPFVNSNSNLFPGEGGVYVVSRQTITLLKIS